MKSKAIDKRRTSFPYYKVQYYDNNVMAWHDIQKSFKTNKDAEKHGALLKRRYRVMQINRTGRKVV